METEGIHEADSGAPTRFVGKVPLAKTWQIAQLWKVRIPIDFPSDFERYRTGTRIRLRDGARDGARDGDEILDVEILDVELTGTKFFWSLTVCKIEGSGNLVLEI